MTPVVDPVISVEALAKSFGPTHALNGLDLQVRPGEVHGFLGPNGAGKTTTIRVLLGLVRADGGRARLFGGDPWTDATALHRRLAYVPGDVTLWPTLTGGEAIDVLGRLRSPGGVDRARRDALVERFALDPTKRCRTYSKGNRQKVALVAAFAADVELLVLDEPTSGLDPLMEAVFRDLVSQAKADGRTVLLSSHLLDEVEVLCDRVSIVRAGRTVSSGPLGELRGRRETTLTAQLGSIPADLHERLTGATDIELDGSVLRCRVTPEQLPRVLGQLAGWDVCGLTSGPPSLEELFLSHYRADGPDHPVDVEPAVLANASRSAR